MDKKRTDTVIPETYAFLLDRTVKRMRQYSMKQLRKAKAGITLDQWAIMKRLHETGPLWMAELASDTFKDPAAVTRIVDALVDAKMVAKYSEPADRRKHIVNLTFEGREKIEQLLPTVLGIRAKGLEGLSDEEVKSLNKLLHKIDGNFQD